MRKKILFLISMLFLFTIFYVNADENFQYNEIEYGTGNVQKIVKLKPYEKKYIDPYVITNRKNTTIMAPYTNKDGLIGGNINDISGRLSSMTEHLYKYGNYGMQNNNNGFFNYGYFTVSNAKYHLYLGKRSSCTEDCGGGIKFKYNKCMREDQKLVDIKFCGDNAKSYEFVECNTQACIEPKTCTKKTAFVHNSYYFRNDFNCSAGSTVRTGVYYAYGCASGPFMRGSTSCLTIPKDAKNVYLDNSNLIARALCHYEVCD